MECISLLDEWKDKEKQLSEKLIPMYTYHLAARKKIIAYLTFRELCVFYKRIENVDIKRIEGHLGFWNCFIYKHPTLMLILSATIMPLLRAVRIVKRKLINKI